MKAISLLQPWASLVVLGHKKIETRSWNTKYRGKIFIHASASKKGLKMIDSEMWDLFNRLCFNVDTLPYGAIIGDAYLRWTQHSEILKERLSERSNILIEHILHSGKQELAFGDYSPGRWCWMLDDADQLSKHIPAKGSLGIWNYPLLDFVHESLKR